MKKVTISLVLFLSGFSFSNVFAGEIISQVVQNPYYGNQFFSDVLSQKHDEALKTELKIILKSGHVEAANSPDQIVSNCESQKNCKMQTSLGYDGARKFLFGKFFKHIGYRCCTRFHPIRDGVGGYGSLSIFQEFINGF